MGLCDQPTICGDMLLLQSKTPLVYPAAYMVLEATRILSTESLYQHSPGKKAPIHSAVLLLVSELLKLAIATSMVLLGTRRITWSKVPFILLSTALYFINNALYFRAVQMASASSVQFLAYLRLPLTAVLHHLTIRPQRLIGPWLSLMVLFSGVVLTQVNPDLTWVPLGVVAICFLMAINSATTAVYTEKLLKDLNMDFWEQQAVMYATGAILAAFYSLGVADKAIVPESFNFHTSFFSAVIIIVNTLFGVVAGLLLKKLDNLIRIIASSLSTISSAILIWILYASDNIHWPFFSLGSMMILTSSYSYTLSMKKTFGRSKEYLPLTDSTTRPNEQSRVTTTSGIVIFALFLFILGTIVLFQI